MLMVMAAGLVVSDSNMEDRLWVSMFLGMVTLGALVCGGWIARGTAKD